MLVLYRHTCTCSAILGNAFWSDLNFSTHSSFKNISILPQTAADAHEVPLPCNGNKNKILDCHCLYIFENKLDGTVFNYIRVLHLFWVLYFSFSMFIINFRESAVRLGHKNQSFVGLINYRNCCRYLGLSKHL